MKTDPNLMCNIRDIFDAWLIPQNGKMVKLPEIVIKYMGWIFQFALKDSEDGFGMPNHFLDAMFCGLWIVLQIDMVWKYI